MINSCPSTTNAFFSPPSLRSGVRGKKEKEGETETGGDAAGVLFTPRLAPEGRKEEEGGIAPLEEKGATSTPPPSLKIGRRERVLSRKPGGSRDRGTDRRRPAKAPFSGEGGGRRPMIH